MAFVKKGASFETAELWARPSLTPRHADNSCHLQLPTTFCLTSVKPHDPEIMCQISLITVASLQLILPLVALVLIF